MSHCSCQQKHYLPTNLSKTLSRYVENAWSLTTAFVLFRRKLEINKLPKSFMALDCANVNKGFCFMDSFQDYEWALWLRWVLVMVSLEGIYLLCPEIFKWFLLSPKEFCNKRWISFARNSIVLKLQVAHFTQSFLFCVRLNSEQDGQPDNVALDNAIQLRGFITFSLILF